MHLFLDFDGVLHPWSAGWDVKDDRLFCFVPLLAKLLDPYPVAIVISSGWRHYFELDDLKAFLGPSIGGRVIGRTPRVGNVRAAAIAAHIEANSITNWLAIDDATCGWPESMRTRVVLTHPALGLEDRAAQARLSELLLRHTNG